MKQIECDGKIYYYNNGCFYDEFFLMVEGVDLQKVAKEYFRALPWGSLKGDSLFESVKQMKASGLYYETEKIIEKLFVKHAKDVDLLQKLLPLYLSCCRELNRPQKAIDGAKVLLPICGGSSATYTSLAAAYCDIKDYENAKKYARVAYAKQGGGKGYKTELSLVFMRLKKETGEDLADKED